MIRVRLDRAIEIAPDSVMAHLQRAHLLDKQNEFQRELVDLDDILSLDPGMRLAIRLREPVMQRLRSN